VLHQKVAQLLAFSNEKVNRVFELSRGEVDRLHQFVAAGHHVNIVIFTMEREQLELPGLPTVEHAETIGFDADVVEIDDAGHADVLLDPGVFDSLGIDAEDPLGEIAEGAVGFLLEFENLTDLLGRQNALFDK